MKRRTKIIATIGPSSSPELVLKQLIEKGLNIARLNFSFGDYGLHGKNIINIRRLANKLNKNLAILQDIQGPKIRITEIMNGQIELECDDELIITSENEISQKNEIRISYNKLAKII
ncbi:MAG: pyruvate kinase, partial [Candidatus Lokiarchaeota archaeon]|nr:pyruvate kinase [Candidatus Lokiarchaeota archaeon]